MVKEIVRNTEILSRVSATVNKTNTAEAIQAVEDLIDTAMAHSDNCLGLAAIQIGVPLNIIVVRNGNTYKPMINPVITWRSKDTKTVAEGCLSFDGLTDVTRPLGIEIMFQERIGGKFKRLRLRDNDTETPFARIIQHEIDHLKGVLI